MKLCDSPGICSPSPHIVLCEGGLELTLVLVCLATCEPQEGTDFHGIDATGMVPPAAAITEAIPEVVEFRRMSGEIDDMVRVVVPDIAAYDSVYKRLISDIDLFDTRSSPPMPGSTRSA